MIKLITSNTKKYREFSEILQSCKVKIEVCSEKIIECQDKDFITCIQFKALQAANKYGEPVLVDDSGLVLEQYAPFPGTITKLVLKQLGISGLKKLVGSGSKKAKMITLLGIAIEDKVFHWQGVISGQLNFERPIKDHKMPLSDIFIPDSNSSPKLAHRVNALKALKKDILKIHIKIDALKSKHVPYLFKNDSDCPFCIEIDNKENSLFRTIVGNKLENRILYEDKYFILLVPLGQFIEGGLLLLSKQHIPSFAHLKSNLYGELEKLINKIKISLKNIFGISPIIFEHGSALNKTKGRCCVDHAHLNIFPVSINIHHYMKDRMFFEASNIRDIAQMKLYPEGYIFFDSPLTGQLIYDGVNIQSQLIRKFITKELGCEDRWHWANYIGIEEMIKTMQKLSGVIK
jgi:ATP adenylyltransferase